MSMSATRRRAVLAAGGLATTAGLTLAGAVSAGAATPPPGPGSSTLPATTAERDCDQTLPTGVRGVPTSFAAGEQGGDYIWHDDSGWHLRITQSSHDPHVYTGSIHTSGPIHYSRFELEKNDVVSLSADGRTLTYRFTNVGHVDGIDFTDSCSLNSGFALARDGHELTPAQVHLGAHDARPESVPFTIERRV